MGSKKIFIAGIDKTMISDLENNLSKFGYNIAGIGRTPEDVLKKTEQSCPDIIFMEVNLKAKIDSIETAEFLRKRTDIPIIFISDHPNEFLSKRMKFIDPSFLVLKPINFQELEVNLKIALNKYAADKKIKENLEKQKHINKQLMINIAERKNAEEELSKSEEHYRELVDNALDIIYTMDLEGNLKSINPIAEKVFGMKSSQIIGMNIREVLTPESFVLSIKYLNNKLENTKKTTNYEVDMITAGKTISRFEINSFLRYKNGKPFEVFGVARDVTDRNLAQRSKMAAYKISELVHKMQSLDELYKSIHNIINELMLAHNFYIALLNYDDNFISFPYFVDEYDTCPRPRKQGNGLTEYVINNGETLYLEPNNVKSFLVSKDVTIVGKKPVYWIGVPLKNKNLTFGMIAVQSYDKNSVVGENEKLMLQFVSTQIAHAIASKRTEYIIQKTERELNAIITSLDDLVLEVNDKLEILNVWTANPQYTLWYRHNILNKNLQESEDSLFTPFKEAINEVFKTKKSQYIELFYNIEDYKIWFGAKINSIDDKNEKKVSILMRDITNKKLIENELIKAKEKAEKATIAKQQFISNMSHEIRTPINAIKGFTEILLNEQLDKSIIEDVINIQYSVNNLQHIINDILDSAKIESGNVSFEFIEFDIRNLVDKLYESLRALSMDKNLTVNIKIDDKVPALLIGDPFRLNQILLNITANAVKFTEHGSVDIEIICLERNTGSVKIQFVVSDTGIGIPKEKLDTIFDLYSQADYSIYRKYGGTGLGLSISKRLIDLIGGTISVHSVVNRGTKFIIELLFRIGEAKVLPLKTPEIKTFDELSGINILYVEDTELNIILVTKILNSWNIQFETAINGKQALDLIRKNNYDLILLDLQMPEISGLDLIKIIRDPNSDVINHTVPIVILTADAFKETKDVAQEAGADDYITKPFSQNDLYHSIINNVRKKSNEKVVADYIEEPDGVEVNRNKYIDLSVLKKLISNNDLALKNIYEEFLHSTEKDVNNLKDLFSIKDMDGVKIITHKLKSSFKYMGMKSIEEGMAELDKLCNGVGKYDRIKVLMDEMLLYYGNARKELLEELSRIK